MPIVQSLADAVTALEEKVAAAITFIRSIEAQLQNVLTAEEQEALAARISAKLGELDPAIDGDPNT